MHPLIKAAYDDQDRILSLLEKHADQIQLTAAILGAKRLQCYATDICVVGDLITDSTEEIGEMTAALATAGFVNSGETIGWNGGRRSNLHLKHEKDATLSVMLCVVEKTPGSLFAVEDGKVRWLRFDEIDARRQEQESDRLADAEHGRQMAEAYGPL